MRAIHIVASTGDIIETETSGTLDELCEMVGAEYLTAVSLPNGDALWLDDNGALNGTTFGFEFAGQRYYGDAVILGVDEWGENTDAVISEFEMMFLLGRRYA